MALTRAATTPRYGGTLRVEVPAASLSLDPREWRDGSLEAAANAKFAGLVFERLVALDNFGHIRPVLASEWSHDATSRRWQLTIRSGVKFSDGTALTPSDVVTALQPLLPPSLQISVGTANTIVVQTNEAAPDLLEQLASGRFFVYRPGTSGGLIGTGPFVFGEVPAGVASAEPSRANGPANGSAVIPTHIYFRANDEAWSGRPFLDGLDVTLGVPALRGLFDLQLGKADLVVLAPELVPRARQANLRVWSSDPVVLYGLRFEETQSAIADPQLRQALSLALDRGTMANVLLQKQAEPAAALLPQWLSGYAFLFTVETNLERAKELRRSPAGTAPVSAVPLRLRVDTVGDLPKLLGERVAVNARQATIAIQVVGRTPLRNAGAPATPEPASGVHLFAWHYSSLSARAELDAMFAAFSLAAPAQSNATDADREQLFAREHQVLDDWRVLPLVEQAESVGVGTAVRNWTPARWGEWHLADVWLELGAEAGAPQ